MPRGALKTASDFSAGFGDIFGAYYIRKIVHCHCEDVIDKHSTAYTTGSVAGLADAAAISALSLAKGLAGLETKIAIHGAHHAFPLIGEVPHLQIMWWLSGVAGSAQRMLGSPIRIPLTPCWP